MNLSIMWSVTIIVLNQIGALIQYYKYKWVLIPTQSAQRSTKQM